jgi:phosphoglycolate phosphatase-like HAD superfamily hydrolase
MKTQLFLFDIDGTMIYTHGIPRKAMRKVLNNRYPNFRYDKNFNFSGRTDWEIIEHLLRFDGKEFTPDIIHELLGEFSIELEEALKNGKKPFIYPGIEELLKQLSLFDNVYLGLVTGNIEKGAQIKLDAAGLSQYFPIGGYGNDSKYRNDLAPLAIDRAREHYGINTEKENTWIIGDSIHDIYCAQHNNLRCLAVSTGWTHYDELKSAIPEYLVKDFSDVKSILKILLET